MATAKICDITREVIPDNYEQGGTFKIDIYRNGNKLDLGQTIYETLVSVLINNLPPGADLATIKVDGKMQRKCNKKYYEKNKDKVRATQKAYYEKKKALKQQDPKPQLTAEEKRAKHREYMRNYYHKNKPATVKSHKKDANKSYADFQDEFHEKKPGIKRQDGLNPIGRPSNGAPGSDQ